MSRAWWKLVGRSRWARRRAGYELWALRAAILRALRSGRRTDGRARSTRLTVVLAVLAASPFALAGVVSVALLSPAESESGAAPDRVKVSTPPNGAEAQPAQQGGRAPERRRRTAPAPVPVAVPVEPPAPAPAVPAAEESPAADPPAAEQPSPETPEPTGRADLEPGPRPEEQERAPSEDERLLEPPTADPAPEEPPAPPAGEPLPAPPGETGDGSAPAPEVPAAP